MLLFSMISSSYTSLQSTGQYLFSLLFERRFRLKLDSLGRSRGTKRLAYPEKKVALHTDPPIE